MRFIRMSIVALAAVGAFMAFAGQAYAAADKAATVAVPKTVNSEGHGGNSVVCGGVPTKAILVRLANGGADACGNRDIAAIWRSFGITPEVAKTMRRSTVCASGGWTSSGRRHSPQPSADRPRRAGSTVFFVRPLAVWGNTCYDAWVGTLEDGTQVAVLVGCGNPEFRGRPRPQPVSKKAPVKPFPVPPAKPAKPAKAKAKAASTTYVRVNCPGAVVIVKASASAIAAAKATGPGTSARAKAKAKTAVAVICKQAAKAKKKFGRLLIKKVTDPLVTKGGPFRVCIKALNKKLILCYPIVSGQTVTVRNRGKDVLFSPGVKVNVCEDPVAGWVTPGCRTVTIKRGLNRVTIFNRLVQAAKVCVTKRTFEDGTETTGRADRLVSFIIEFRGQRFGLPNDGRIYCFVESFAAGTILTVTETDAKGFTPDAAAISVTAGGEVGVFVNRKVTPLLPPPPPVKPPPPVIPPPPVVPPKSGVPGPGAGTPGQPGGPGAGGEPGVGPGPTCRDSSGNIVPGNSQADGTCVGSTSTTTGQSGPAPGSPPPPPSGQCIDPNNPTGPKKTGPADQFGYCV